MTILTKLNWFANIVAHKWKWAGNSVRINVKAHLGMRMFMKDVDLFVLFKTP